MLEVTGHLLNSTRTYDTMTTKAVHVKVIACELLIGCWQRTGIIEKEGRRLHCPPNKCAVTAKLSQVDPSCTHRYTAQALHLICR